MKEYVELGKDGQLILPASIRRAAKLQEGDVLKVVIDEDSSIHLMAVTAAEQKLIEQSQLKDIRKARGMLKGISTENIREETDEER
jgi:AbrB family looped-hinge helix DNA binding protein